MIYSTNMFGLRMEGRVLGEINRTLIITKYDKSRLFKIKIFDKLLHPKQFLGTFNNDNIFGFCGNRAMHF